MCALESLQKHEIGNKLEHDSKGKTEPHPVNIQGPY